MAPGANILLVETPVTETEGVHGFPEIVKAENYVIKHHLADVISQSFGASEATFPTAQSVLDLRSAFKAAQQANVSVLASSGDSGAADVADNSGSRTCCTRRPAGRPPTRWSPASVGCSTSWTPRAPDRPRPSGTTRRCSARPAAGGGGRSIFFPARLPGLAWPRRIGSHRGVPDISLCRGRRRGDRLPRPAPTAATPAASTSTAAPASRRPRSPDRRYRRPAGRPPARPAQPGDVQAERPARLGPEDITDGTNTVSFNQGGKPHTVLGWDARSGYDLATGVGGIDGALFVPQLVKASS